MVAIKISSRVEEAAWDELRGLARERKRSVSELLSEAVEEYLARRMPAGTPAHPVCAVQVLAC
jgi:predicted DNA-binding ribbon-helix-helix protein